MDRKGIGYAQRARDVRTVRKGKRIMRNTDLKTMQEKATAAKMLMDYIMNRSMDLYPCKGLEMLAPYRSRVEWIEDGHMWLLQLDIIRPEDWPEIRDVRARKDGEPVRFVEVENSIERMQDTIEAELKKRARQRQKAAEEADRAAQRRRNAERRLRELMENDTAPAYAYVYARG